MCPKENCVYANQNGRINKAWLKVWSKNRWSKFHIFDKESLRSLLSSSSLQILLDLRVTNATKNTVEKNSTCLRCFCRSFPELKSQECFSSAWFLENDQVNRNESLWSCLPIISWKQTWTQLHKAREVKKFRDNRRRNCVLKQVEPNEFLKRRESYAQRPFSSPWDLLFHRTTFVTPSRWSFSIFDLHIY